MLGILSSGNAVIEDMENNIIYIVGKEGQVRIIDGYQETYTQIQNIPIKVTMPMMKLMLEKMRTISNKDDSEDKLEVVEVLSEGLSLIEQLNKGGLIE